MRTQGNAPLRRFYARFTSEDEARKRTEFIS